MAGAALALHRASPNVYDLSGLRTSSLRDQLLRSRVLVDCLDKENCLKPDRPLYIFGGGPAGVEASLAASAKGHSVVLVESCPDVLESMELAWFRDVGPRDYDWPNPLSNGSFPRSPQPIGLHYVHSTPAPLILAWRTAFHHWISELDAGNAGPGRIKARFRTDARVTFRVSDLGPGSGVEIAETGAPVVVAGALLKCYGPGLEQTGEQAGGSAWNGYEGPLFWTQYDELAPGRVNLHPRIRQVLISGGGDGAMQDFLRAATGACGPALFAALERAYADIGLPTFVDAIDLYEMLAAEDYGRRAHAWRHDGDRATALRAWHDPFEVCVQRCRQRLSPRDCETILQKVLRPDVLSGNPKVVWVHRGSAPSFCYALNRFLALMLMSIVNGVRACDRPPIHYVPNNEVVSISAPASPHSSGVFPIPALIMAPPSWDLEPRRVTFAQPVPASLSKEYELIIIRHGSRSPPGTAAVPEQMVPYDLP